MVPCGCTVATDPLSGVLRSVSKCLVHRRAYREPSTLDESYFRENGVFGGTHMPQLLEALGPFPAAFGSREALEIGCGCSPYAGAIKAAGWRYTGVDCSPWAAEWTASRWGVAAEACLWEQWPVAQSCGLILAAHVLEHLEDAPGSLSKMAAAMEPGAELWVIVPDDSDLANPDHLWFFSPITLHATIERIGLSVKVLEMRKYIERENFLYLRAVKL